MPFAWLLPLLRVAQDHQEPNQEYNVPQRDQAELPTPRDMNGLHHLADEFL